MSRDVQQDLVEKAGPNTLDKMADAALAKSSGEQMRAFADVIRAFGNTMVEVTTAHHAQSMELHGAIEHYQRESFENGARAVISEVFYGQKSGTPTSAEMVKEAKDLIKELGSLGFSLVGAIKGEPEKLLEAWRQTKVAAPAIGRLLKRMTAEEWKELGGLIGPENSAELGKAILPALGAEKSARLIGAGLAALDDAGLSALLAAVPAELRARLRGSMVSTMSPAETGALAVSMVGGLTAQGAGQLWKALPAASRSRLAQGIAGAMSPEEREALAAAIMGGAST